MKKICGNFTDEELEILEIAIQEKKAREVAEAEEKLTHERIEAVRLKREQTFDAIYKDMRNRMKLFEDEAGELIHDTDFQWYMLSLLMNNIGLFSQGRPSNKDYEPNTYTHNLIRAYKRNKGME